MKWGIILAGRCLCNSRPSWFAWSLLKSELHPADLSLLIVALKFHIFWFFSPFELAWIVTFVMGQLVFPLISCLLPSWSHFDGVCFICSVLKKWDELEGHLTYPLVVVFLVFSCIWRQLILCFIYYFDCFCYESLLSLMYYESLASLMFWEPLLTLGVYMCLW
jgi:hypothetical protein